jgi:hypothetical protein
MTEPSDQADGDGGFPPPSWVTTTCEHFDLGRPQRWRPVDGDTSNEIVRVVTSLGLFALKRMVANAATPAFESDLARACRVEQRALAAGVPMAEPIADRDSGLAMARVGDDLVRVHRWADGEPLVPATVTADDARAAGRLLALVHAAGRPAASVPAPPARFGDQFWALIVEHAARAQSPLAADLAAEHASLATLDDQLAQPTPAQWLCVDAHLSLGADQTLRRVDASLLALDWDDAGPVRAHQDTVATALRWARPGLDATEIVYARVKAFAAGFVQQGGELPHTVDPALGSVWIRDLLGSLAYNVQRAAAGNDVEIAVAQARSSLRAARDAVWALPDLLGLIVR